MDEKSPPRKSHDEFPFSYEVKPISSLAHTLTLTFSARVGYEQIYRALFDSLGMRVHVEPAEYEFFSCLPSVQECLTTDSTSTCLHACRTASSNFSQPCSSFRHCDKPVRILLSIMWFTEQIAASESTSRLRFPSIVGLLRRRTLGGIPRVSLDFRTASIQALSRRAR